MKRNAFMLRSQRLHALREFPDRAFTLAELLVVIALIAILATITIVAVGAIAKNARLATGINVVTASLENGRAIAMRDNKFVAVAFRAVWNPDDPDVPQVTRVVIAQWSGDTEWFTSSGSTLTKDRFLPVADAPQRDLPPGIKVAAPFYDDNNDETWVTQPELRLSEPGTPMSAESSQPRMIAVVYSPDGSVVTSIAVSSSALGQVYVDFSQDDADGDGDNQEVGDTPASSTQFFIYDEPDDEPNVNFAPFLTVYDDDAAREMMGDDDWTSVVTYINELTGPNGYITRNADRIHFNRYTGVVMK